MTKMDATKLGLKPCEAIPEPTKTRKSGPYVALIETFLASSEPCQEVHIAEKVTPGDTVQVYVALRNAVTRRGITSVKVRKRGLKVFLEKVDEDSAE